ncbi:MAG: hypothetical protein ACQERT_12720 [Thermodesulfobacteriota bacterium]
MRHDVDKFPANALKMAELEHNLDIPASYYFRAVLESWDEAVIRKIAGLDHEVGYHYENLSMFKGDMDKAFADFEVNLERLRKLVPVSTVCMHGSPLSRINNLDLWKKYDYRELDIIGEPYLDVDYNQVFYITDTGRKWNNEGASIRDRVESGFDIEIKSTKHLMELVKRGKDKRKSSAHEITRKSTKGRRDELSAGEKIPADKASPLRGQEKDCYSCGSCVSWADILPDKIMINVHPQRWFDFGPGWVKEFVGQPIKNIAKTMIIKIHKKR